MTMLTLIQDLIELREDLKIRRMEEQRDTMGKPWPEELLLDKILEGVRVQEAIRECDNSGLVGLSPMNGI